MRRLILVSLIVSILLPIIPIMMPTSARAGGLFLPGHGVRGLARGGAFTAGGDDPGGIWYNPANIGGLKGWHALVDASVILLKMDYERVDSGGNLLPEVSNEGPLMPVPTLGLVKDVEIMDKRVQLGFSLAAPYAPLPGYPEPNYGPCFDPASPSQCIDTAHTDAPQRYSLISLEGTIFLQLDLAVAYELFEDLTVGVSLQNMFANFISLTSLTSDNGVLASGPEDPDFDALSQMKMLDLFNPSLKLGVLYSPDPMVRLGASLQLPFWIGGGAKVNVQLPVSPVYEKSSVQGDQADVELTLPLTVRTGVELRPLSALRLEAGFDWAHWSMLDAIRIKPENIYMLNIPSIDRYKVPEQQIVLNFRDTITLRLGGEYTLPVVPVILRAGYIYERGAVDNAYASVLAMDSNKHMTTLGLGVKLSNIRLDVVYAHAFLSERIVNFSESRSPQVNPINPTGAAYVGGGRYAGFMDVIGAGVSGVF